MAENWFRVLRIRSSECTESWFIIWHSSLRDIVVIGGICTALNSLQDIMVTGGICTALNCMTLSSVANALPHPRAWNILCSLKVDIRPHNFVGEILMQIGIRLEIATTVSIRRKLQELYEPVVQQRCEPSNGSAFRVWRSYRLLHTTCLSKILPAPV